MLTLFYAIRIIVEQDGQNIKYKSVVEQVEDIEYFKMYLRQQIKAGRVIDRIEERETTATQIYYLK